MEWHPESLMDIGYDFGRKFTGHTAFHTKIGLYLGARPYDAYVALIQRQYGSPPEGLDLNLMMRLGNYNPSVLDEIVQNERIIYICEKFYCLGA